MDRRLGYLGLALIGVGVVYLTLTHPFFPGWVWGLLFAALFFALDVRFRSPALRASALLLFGWAVGAAFSDFTGILAFKLVGLGAAIWGLGTLAEVEDIRFVGLALVVAGGIVGLFEVGAAPWVALVSVGVGVWLVVWGARRSPPDDGFEARYRRLLAWRRAKAEAVGKRVDEVLSDEEVARLARAESREELEAVLGPTRGEWVEELAALLLEAQRVP